jgi:transcriptional regulator with PAS, ATPase and Fis domain
MMRRRAGTDTRDQNFTLYGAVHEFEERLVEQALEETAGSVTRAAKLLGIRYQSLSSIIAGRHKRLLKKRTPPERRRRSTIKKK